MSKLRTRPAPGPWREAAEQLAGLLRMRDGVRALAETHEAKAADLRAQGHNDRAEVQGRYAERLRKLLTEETGR